MTGEESLGSNLKARCIACKEPIQSDARLCSECGSYQQGWKNTLRYAANVVGVFGIAAMLFTYVVSQMPEIRKVLAWEDGAHVISFTDLDYISVLNTEDGDVLLSHVAIQTEQGGRTTVSINRVAKPREVVIHTFLPPEKNPLVSYHTLSGLPESEWQAAVSIAKAPDLSPGPCIAYAIYHERDPSVLMFKAHSESRLQRPLQTMRATAVLHSLSLRR
jgi:predicted nucleic acid-binding Zn ribbon protein